MVKTWPAKPDFVNDAERVVWDALKDQLRDSDVLLHGMRFTDPQDGDVEIDLLVLMPDLGAAVIEVKGGHITYAKGSVRQTGANGTVAIDPAAQAAKELRALKRFLERQPTWSRGRLRGAWLVAFPYTKTTNELGPQLPDMAVIGGHKLADAAGVVYDRLRDNAIQYGTPKPGWVDAALDALLGTLDEPGEIRARAAQRLRHVDDLTVEQATLLSVVQLIPRFEVVGSAGTGKTWLAMEQARRWAESGERVCFVTYTRGVAEVVRGALADLPEGKRPTFIGTFHQLGFTWGVQPAGDQSHSYWANVAPQQIQAVAERVPDTERFTTFVVDEAQDFADAWWPALFAAGSPDFKVAVFRDDEQTVFTERKGRPDIDLVPLTLNENLRNAQQIVDTFRPLVAAPITSRSGPGFPVEFVACAPGDAIGVADDVVSDLLERRGWLPEHVALLTTKHRHPVHAEYDTDKTAYWASLWDKDEVFYGTVAGFKGLERSVVVLAVDGFHEGVDPRNVLYAGMSRARDLLVVVAPPVVIEHVDTKLARRLSQGG